ncbi:MAG: glycosyltransferase [Candidatus Cyclobacteriaceae bacterium M2_1C_046]
MIYAILAIASFGLIINLLLIIFWTRNFKTYPVKQKQPFVSVLIAARNEEKNLARCINALVKQNYPLHHFEILIGNDQSEDNTLNVARKLSDEFENVHVINITAGAGEAKGKANVLAQLAKKAKGEYYLITDADIAVNENWIKAMVNQVDKGIGIVNGFTVVENNLMQYYEWAHALGMVKVIHDAGQPVTAIGNNMLITKEAYRSTGGYENIKFSLTEDYAIFKEVSGKGYQLRQAVNKDTLAYSLPAKNLLHLLHQRKRWMTGAVQLPWFVVLILLLEGLYYPAIIALLILAPMTGLYIFLSKLLVQSIFIKLVLKKVDLSLKGGLLIYEIYAGFITLFSMIFYLLPGKINWKGRKYKKT